MVDSKNMDSLILSHYEKVWGPCSRAIKWEKGPISQLPFEFRIFVFQKNDYSKVLATCGMSLIPGKNPMELHFYLSNHDDYEERIAELLTIVAHYHLTGRGLGLGHTINWGEPVVAGSKCEYGYISLPYLDGPELEDMPPHETKFYWLLPITFQELGYKKVYGVEAFENLFEEHGINYLDLHRDSMC